jgi:hypothetical protein
MKLYKFRSFKNTNYILDILKNHRFYASKYNELNDPMEGFFRHDCTFNMRETRNIILGKHKTRICSFSRSLGNPLLWAHYADSFKGICVEIGINDNHQYKLEPVAYPLARLRLTDADKFDLNSFIDKALLSKSRIWKYEEEMRILTKDKYVKDDISINAIHIGVGISEENKWLIEKIVANIPVYETTISKDTDIVEIKSIIN